MGTTPLKYAIHSIIRSLGHFVLNDIFTRDYVLEVVNIPKQTYSGKDGYNPILLVSPEYKTTSK